MKKTFRLFVAPLLLSALPVMASTSADVLESTDIFNLEYAAQLNMRPDGESVFYVRHFMDKQSDRKLGNIWMLDIDTGEHLPITTGSSMDYNPVISPDGARLAYISTASGKPQIHMRWLKSGHTAKLTSLESAPSGLSWSPDGKYLAFTAFAEDAPNNPVTLKGKPAGAQWADPAVFIDDVYYRFDGGGYGKKGSTEIYVISADGGTARRLTSDKFNNTAPLVWGKQGKFVYFSANRQPMGDFEPLNSDIYRLEVNTGDIKALTDRNGPDGSVAISPNGKQLAYLGFDDKYTNYENSQLYVMDIDGSNRRQVSEGLDRSIDTVKWAEDGKSLFIQYDDQGKTIVAEQSLRNGSKRTVLTDALGGQSYGRPYTQGEFVLGKDDLLVFTLSDTQRPADIALLKRGKVQRITALNDDALGHKSLAKVEEIWFKSRFDGKDIQGWVAYPPGFDKSKTYPLILEIHGGPVTAYGPHFSTEVQLFAAAGNIVLYTNPRGSSSYGKAFANTIDKNYPSQDFDDLMSGVDAVIAKGNVDTDRLYVTGGSGGGVLTAWTVAHTNRFASAVVAKPVINWYSFVLTADFYPFFYKYWFGKKPWEDLDTYMKYSPISYVGQVKTPTMLLTGEADFRTPISETEQYYQALKLQGVETAMVRIPGASHGIYQRPSHLMNKVEYILWWFSQHDSLENSQARAKDADLAAGDIAQ